MLLPLYLAVLHAVEPDHIPMVNRAMLSGLSIVAVGLYLLFKA